MLYLGMRGPYPLVKKAINTLVSRVSPGNYALGRRREGKAIPFYIGRSDDDLNGRLKKWLEDISNGPEKSFEAEFFWFSYARSANEAFEKECRDYHITLGRLENKAHPYSPEGTDLKCQVCNK